MRPGPRPSRCTDWTPTTESVGGPVGGPGGTKCKEPRRSHWGYFSDSRPHESLQALFSRDSGRAFTGGEAGAVPLQKDRCTMADSSSTGEISESHFLTVAEVAAMMRVSKMTVYRLVHSGELPAVRVGRSFRVLEKDVDDYLRKSFYNAG